VEERSRHVDDKLDRQQDGWMAGCLDASKMYDVCMYYCMYVNWPANQNNKVDRCPAFVAALKCNTIYIINSIVLHSYHYFPFKDVLRNNLLLLLPPCLEASRART
jgi:hypothetical protein